MASRARRSIGPVVIPGALVPVALALVPAGQVWLTYTLWAMALVTSGGTATLQIRVGTGLLPDEAVEVFQITAINAPQRFTTRLVFEGPETIWAFNGDVGDTVLFAMHAAELTL